ncbi:MAG: hypothetical protein ABIJ27_07635 [Candidatus Omnitrophota bacterium]
MKEKKTVLFVMIFFLSVLMPAQGQDEIAQKSVSERNRLIEEKREKVKNKKEELDGAVWDIMITPSVDGKMVKPARRADKLTFSNLKVSSEKFFQDGYAATNYSLRFKPGGLVIWETMQSKEGDALVFWRGELRGESMKGIINRTNQNGDLIEALSFVSAGVVGGAKIQKDEKPRSSKVSTQGTAPLRPKDDARVVPVEPKKEKKHWWQR